MRYSIQQIGSILGSTSIFERDDTIEQLIIDSRKVYFPATSLFFAIAGLKRNGHLFIDTLYKQGVRNFVISENVNAEKYIGANFIRVVNSIEALQQLAAYHRKQFSYPVIGITGSNGKTIVKELLFQLLSPDFSIVRSPKSYNSQIGVPLSVWEMNPQHNLGIFEAGISLPGEMNALAKIICPTIGILNFIGEAHAEGFQNKTQKIQEKLLLFQQTEILFYSSDDELVQQEVKSFAEKHPLVKLFAWGKKSGAKLLVKEIQKSVSSTDITCEYEHQSIQFSIPFVDDASIYNVLSIYGILLFLKVTPEVIAKRMLQLRPLEMRLELKQGINNCSIINDGYSLDINSLIIALDFLQQQQQHEKRTLILSDVLQTKQNAEELYLHIAKIIEEKQIDRFIGIGTELWNHQYLFSKIPSNSFYKSTEDFLAEFTRINFGNETVLIKGARIFELEKISKLLEQKTHQTILEINLSAIKFNLDIYRRKLNPGVKMMAMVKAFSYGSGSFEIANILQYAGIDYLAVAYADEGVELRNAGVRLPIMVMNVDEETFASLLQYNLEPELFSFGILKSFQQYLIAQKRTNYPVHIKLDTGMHRLGFEQNDIHDLVDIISSSNTFKIQSVFSHLVASDDAVHDAFTAHQFELFTLMSNKLKAIDNGDFLQHISNTSAIERFPNLQLDMVRLGIGMYGVDGNQIMQQQLKTVATLKTSIAQIRRVKKGETVGYSRKGILLRDSIIATVRIGYADGYHRSLGNGVGKMFVNGEFAPVVGNICMDMTMIDITGIEAREEDEVLVFGTQLPVYEVAKSAGTIAYEILAGISQRVKRVYYEE